MRSRRPKSGFSLYGSHKTTKQKLFTLLKILLSIILSYLIISSIFLTSYRVESVSMYPELDEGDRILVSPLVFGGRLPFSGTRLPPLRLPKRGEIVVCTAPYSDEGRFSRYTVKPLLRFFTLGFVSTGFDSKTDWEQGPVIKRVIGLPGDTVKIENNRVFIKEPAASSYKEETAAVIKEYLLSDGGKDPNWPSVFPLGSAMTPLTLSENEYFVLGDNRSQSLDSRHWGVISIEDMEGLVFLRYWPFKKFDAL